MSIPTSTKRKRFFREALLIGALFAGACGQDTQDGGTPPPEEDAAGEQSLTAECPTYGWKYLQFGTKEDDEAVAIAADSTCRIYVAGNTLGELTVPDEKGQYQDGFITRLQNDGKRAWTRQFGTEGLDTVRDLAVDPAGTSYVVGSAEGDGSFLTTTATTDALFASFQEDGTPRWLTTSGEVEDDYGQAVALKGDDSPVVASASFADPLNNWELWLMGLGAADGKLGSHSLFGTPEYDRPEALAVDSASGDIFMVGATAGDMSGVNKGSADVFLRKHSADLSTAWIKQLGTADIDAARRVVRNAATGDLYVLAISYSNLQSGVSENDGIVSPFVIKFDQSGMRKWVVRIGSAGTAAQARGLALGPTGDLYVAGSTSGQIGDRKSVV